MEALERPGFQARSWLPFFHLRREGFWSLSAQADAESRLGTMVSPKSNRQLHDVVSHAALNDEAWSQIQSSEARVAMRSILLTTYFGDEEQAKLLGAMRDEDDLRSYIAELLDCAPRESFQIRHDEPLTATRTQPVRDRPGGCCRIRPIVLITRRQLPAESAHFRSVAMPLGAPASFGRHGSAYCRISVAMNSWARVQAATAWAASRRIARTSPGRRTGRPCLLVRLRGIWADAERASSPSTSGESR
jgi:hypothetical protein